MGTPIGAALVTVRGLPRQKVRQAGLPLREVPMWITLSSDLGEAVKGDDHEWNSVPSVIQQSIILRYFDLEMILSTIKIFNQNTVYAVEETRFFLRNQFAFFIV